MSSRSILFGLFACCSLIFQSSANAQFTWFGTAGDDNPFTESNWFDTGGANPAVINPSTPFGDALILSAGTPTGAAGALLDLGSAGSLSISGGIFDMSLSGVRNDGAGDAAGQPLVSVSGNGQLLMGAVVDLAISVTGDGVVSFTGATNGGIHSSTTIRLLSSTATLIVNDYSDAVLTQITVEGALAAEGVNVRLVPGGGTTVVILPIGDFAALPPGIVVAPPTTTLPPPIGIVPGLGDTLFRGFNNIGGVRIDADGVLANVAVGQTKRLNRIRQLALDPIPGDLETYTDRRFVSLRRLSKMVTDCRAAGKPLPGEVRYLAGLQRVEFVLALPESNDIVLAGPAEGWRIDALGNVVGATTGRAVLMMDDLIVALETYSDLGAGATCSIDPTPDGLRRVQILAQKFRPNTNPKVASRLIEEALGPQQITLHGIDETSHFARVMIAADYRMKRIGMKLDRAPIDGLPSYLDMTKAGRRGMSATPPRWWLAPKYDTLHTDGERLAWELRGPGVECLAEEDLIGSDGRRTQTRKATGAARRWAELMTEKYGELADHDSTFGQLRNLMDLAVAAAIIGHERMEDRTGVDLSGLAAADLSNHFNVPRQISTQASLIKKGRKWVISASGGVDVSPWKSVQDVEKVDTVAAIREKAKLNTDQWWWQ